MRRAWHLGAIAAFKFHSKFFAENMLDDLDDWIKFDNFWKKARLDALWREELANKEKKKLTDKIILSLVIDEKFLSSCATGTLIGTIATLYKDKCITDFSKIILKFPASSLAFCQKNKGPKNFIINNFVIPCFLKDIIFLQKIGIEVEVEEFETNYK